MKWPRKACSVLALFSVALMLETSSSLTMTCPTCIQSNCSPISASDCANGVVLDRCRLVTFGVEEFWKERCLCRNIEQKKLL